MQDSIIGYLLGALDDDELAKFESQLKHDRDLQVRVREAARRLEFLRQDDEDIEPPQGLVESTCALVEEFRARPDAQLDSKFGQLVRSTTDGVTHPSSGMPLAASNLVHHGGNSDEWTLIDFFVACCVVLAACLLFFPAVNNSRYHAQVASCQNNLRSIGRALIEYSGANSNGLFPQVPETGNLAFAGVYAPTLKSSGLVENDEQFMCAALNNNTLTETFRIPSLEEIKRTVGENLAVIQERSGGTYGYTLGVNENGRVRGIRNQSRNHFALMSDSPKFYTTLLTSTRKQSDMHRNVLFESGCVRMVCIETECWCGDQLYQNDLGQVSAGVHESDAVIAPSAAAPIIHFANDQL